jgi:hypothetical protein
MRTRSPVIGSLPPCRIDACTDGKRPLYTHRPPRSDRLMQCCLFILHRGASPRVQARLARRHRPKHVGKIEAAFFDSIRVFRDELFGDTASGLGAKYLDEGT